MTISHREAFAVLAAFTAASVTASAEARPLRGPQEATIVLCRFSDAPNDPLELSVSDIKDKLTGRGNQGQGDYWYQASDRAITFDEATITGWHTMSMSVAEGEKFKGGGSADRQKAQRECVDSARRDGARIPKDGLLFVYMSPDLDTFGMPGRGMVLGKWAAPHGISHEIGHALGYGQHSFIDFDWCPGGWGSRGEYGNKYDVMGNQWAFATPSPWSRYDPERGTLFQAGGQAGGLNAYARDRMGWLRRDEIVRFGADGDFDRTIDLISLSQTDRRGTRMVRIPFDRDDPFRYYTVEYRTREGLDRGLPEDTVLIHEIDDRDKVPCDDDGRLVPSKTYRDPAYRNYLIVNEDNTAVAETLRQNGVVIETLGKDPSSGRARIRVRTTRAASCRAGLTERRIDRNDGVCVTRERRREVERETSSAADRRAPNGGRYGPQTCKAGFVWREGVSGDRVCVTPDSRAQANAENRSARLNTLGGSVYGPNTCKTGFVWREGDQRDWVCVTPERRSMVREENTAQAARTSSGRCRAPFIRRGAFLGDDVCVTPASQAAVAAENEAARDRLAKPDA